MYWIDNRRGYLTDWSTQVWVRLSGRRVILHENRWLAGPTAGPHGVGSDFFRSWSDENGYWIGLHQEDAGLVENMAELAGPGFDPAELDPAVRDFYVATADYEIDAWAQWRWPFSPFGGLLARIFSRRLGQLNVPLESLDTSRGMTSEVIVVRQRPGGPRLFAAWVRELLASGQVLYAGAYSTVRIPGHPSACVRVVFPLPNGSAIVIMRPVNGPAGGLRLVSAGRRFGDPGFYFLVTNGEGQSWARYVRAMQETITVYPDGSAGSRADHEMRIWGVTFLELHYRLWKNARQPLPENERSR